MPGPAPSLASSIDLSVAISLQRPTASVAPLIRPVIFTKEQLQSPDLHVKQLNALHLLVAQVTQAHRSHPEQAPITFKNVTCGAGGALVVLPHGFGRNAEYIVTKWKGAATVGGHSLVCDEDDATPTTTKTTLALRSYVAGKANIRVYPEPL